jgi:hypothetical protein
MAQVNTEYLAVMQLDSNELIARSDEQTPMGKLIRKEIQRRKSLGFGYWKGDYAVHKGGIDGTIQTPSRVGTITTYVKGSRR